MFLKNINELRNIEWAKTYLWDIHFGDSELNEFANWFPASSVEEGFLSIKTYQFEASSKAYSIPKGEGQEILRITFLDSVKFTVHNWLVNWVKSTIFNNGDYVSRLSDKGVLKKLTIQRVDNKRLNVTTKIGKRDYWVYPQGGLRFIGDSEGSVISNSMEFVIVDEIKASG